MWILQTCECGTIVEIERPDTELDWTPAFATDDGLIMCAGCYAALPLPDRLSFCRYNNMSIFAARRPQIPPNEYTSCDLESSRLWRARGF